MSAGEERFKTNVEAIAAKNPKVDLKIVREAREIVAGRRAEGRQRRGYSLAPPHSRSV
jgi:hypothetical protein